MSGTPVDLRDTLIADADLAHHHSFAIHNFHYVLDLGLGLAAIDSFQSWGRALISSQPASKRLLV